MNKEDYYTPRTDRQRLSSSQRQVMSLEQRVKELEEEIVRLTIEQGKQREQTPMYMLQTLEETHERMYEITEYCERLQPIKLDSITETDITGNDTNCIYPTTVDISNEEMWTEKTNLFRLKSIDEMSDFDDQTSRSILKDLRKVIKFLQQ
jgi:cysteinyl-tRNA synthetase